MKTDNKNIDLILWKGQRFSKAEFLDFLKREKERVSEAWELRIFHFAEEWLEERNKFFKVETSGSTGPPKEIAISRSQMIASAKATANYLGLKRGDSALMILPADFIAGKMMIVRALVLGLDFHYEEPKIDVLQKVKRKYDFCAAIPLQIQNAIDLHCHEQLELLQKVIIGGASLSKPYLEDLQRIKSRFFATYGMTETITHIALKPLNGALKTNHFKCLPDVHIDRDERDCLRIISSRLPQKITITNDRVELISENEFIWLGRVDLVINTGGLKIQAEALEEQIKEILDVELMIGFREDSELGQRLVLLIEGEGIATASEIRDKLHQILPKNKQPKEILFISQLYRTTNQKINRIQNLEWISKH